MKGTAGDDRGVQAKAALLAEGWERRHMTDPDRAAEAAEMYARAGYEVRVEALEPSDFGAGCSSCASTVCAAFVVLYTRKSPPKQSTQEAP